MSRKRFEAMNCGVAQALEQVGDWWTLLIVRDAFFGLRRFSEFQESLGIAKNILSDRLHKLVEHGVLEKKRLPESGQRYAYTLTPETFKDLQLDARTGDLVFVHDGRWQRIRAKTGKLEEVRSPR